LSKEKPQLIINKQISKESGENKQLKTIFEARKFKKIEINFLGIKEALKCQKWCRK